MEMDILILVMHCWYYSMRQDWMAASFQEAISQRQT